MIDQIQKRILEEVADLSLIHIFTESSVNAGLFFYVIGNYVL